MNIGLFREDAAYPESSDATFHQSGHTFQLKMGATGFARLQNLRDCDALRLKVARENLQIYIVAGDSGRLPVLCHKVVREMEHSAWWNTATPGPTMLTPPSTLSHLVALDEAVFGILSRHSEKLELAAARYAAESAHDWVKP